MNQLRIRQIKNMVDFDNKLSLEEKQYLLNYFVNKEYTTEDVFKFNSLDTIKKQEFLSMIGYRKEKENVITKDKVKTLSLFNNKAAFVSEMYLSFLTGLSLGVLIVSILNLIMLFC